MSDLKYELQLHAGLENITEKIVMEKLKHLIEEEERKSSSGVCLCWVCLADVAAILLNQLKPLYCSNFLDKSKFDKTSKAYQELEQAINEKLPNALEIVRKNPHH